jgi:hypothetical protein
MFHNEMRTYLISEEELMSIVTLVGIVFIVIGLVLLLVGIGQKKKAKAAEEWPTVQGMIMSSGLQEKRHYDSDTHRTSVTYEPQVQYEYSLMGTSYQGNSLSFGKASYNYNTATRNCALSSGSFCNRPL